MSKSTVSGFSIMRIPIGCAMFEEVTEGRF
jgi:hypothetical protein